MLEIPFSYTKFGSLDHLDSPSTPLNSCHMPPQGPRQRNCTPTVQPTSPHCIPFFRCMPHENQEPPRNQLLFEPDQELPSPQVDPQNLPSLFTSWCNPNPITGGLLLTRNAFGFICWVNLHALFLSLLCVSASFARPISSCVP